MLEVDEDSRLGREVLKGGARYRAGLVPNEDAIARMYERAIERLGCGGAAAVRDLQFLPARIRLAAQFALLAAAAVSGRGAGRVVDAACCMQQPWYQGTTASCPDHVKPPDVAPAQVLRSRRRRFARVSCRNGSDGNVAGSGRRSSTKRPGFWVCAPTPAWTSLRCVRSLAKSCLRPRWKPSGGSPKMGFWSSTASVRGSPREDA